MEPFGPDDLAFFSEVERLDREFRNVPHVLRQLDVYHSLVGDEERNAETLSYLNKISLWYQRKYGEAAAWDGVIGLQPIYLRESLFTVEIRHPDVNPSSGASDLREVINARGPVLSPEENRIIGTLFLEASSDFAAFHNIEMRPSLFRKEQRALSRRAWFDLRNAVTLIQSSGDVQGSIVAAHEAAEKFLKIGLIHEGVAYEKLGKRDLKHDLSSLVKALSDKQPKYKYIKSSARELQRLFGSMTKQRYEITTSSLREAVEAFRLARHCSAFVAMQIELDHDRGAKDVEFKIGRYYQDYVGRRYRFCGYEHDESGREISKLYLLGASDDGFTVDAEIRSIGPCSFHYKQIRDPAIIRMLEQHFSSIRQSCNRDRRAEGQNLTAERIHDTFNTMLSVRIPITERDLP